ncbi:hypothetical protein PFISCL1PPCAC_9376, partial [Pristionchus fissidentatus]
PPLLLPSILHVSPTRVRSTMGRYALRSDCKDGCTCGGVGHGRVEKNTVGVQLRPRRLTTISTNGVDQNKQSVPSKPHDRRKTIAAKPKSTVSRKSTVAKKIDSEEEVTVPKKTTIRRKSMVPKKADPDEAVTVSQKSTVRRKSTVTKKAVSKEEVTVPKKEDTADKTTVPSNTSAATAPDTVLVDDMDWPEEEKTQSMLEDESMDLGRGQGEMKSGGDAKTAELDSPIVFRAPAPPVNPASTVKKVHFQFDIPALTDTPNSFRFRAPFKPRLLFPKHTAGSGGGRGGQWDTTEEDMDDDSLLYLMQETFEQEEKNEEIEEKKRENRLMRELEDEINEIQKHDIDPRAIIARLTAENLNLRRTINEMSNQ